MLYSAYPFLPLPRFSYSVQIQSLVHVPYSLFILLLSTFLCGHCYNRLLPPFVIIMFSYPGRCYNGFYSVL